MNVVMSGLDYKTAPIEIREKLSVAKDGLADIYAGIKGCPGVSGAVIISTCNRTEVYLSLAEGVQMDPLETLCRAAGLDFPSFAGLCYKKRGVDAVEYLCELACGVKSQIWGEDQIITQVRQAAETARHYEASDPTLEVMFRNAVTAAKKVKSTLQLNLRGNSAASKTLDILNRNRGIRSVLVMGNGEIGKLTARTLIEAGYSVTVTLRSYRHGGAVAPEGASSVDYSGRYGVIPDMDAIVSATASPHYTIECGALTALGRYPRLFVDLALPRDIDPEIAALPGITVYDIDSISADEMRQNHDEQMARIAPIIRKYTGDFENWLNYRNRLVSV